MKIHVKVIGVNLVDGDVIVGGIRRAATTCSVVIDKPPKLDCFAYWHRFRFTICISDKIRYKCNSARTSMRDGSTVVTRFQANV